MTDLHDIESLWLLGCGNMGSALLDGWIAGGLRPSAITVIDPAMPSLPEGVVSVAALPDDGAPHILIAAVKPQVAQAILKPLSPRMAAGGTLLLSIMAGIDCDSLRAMSGAAHIVRAMPNTPARIGIGITVWTSTPKVDKAQKETAAEVFRSMGEEVFVEDEVYLDMATALSGTGPAYVFLFMEALIDSGVHLGFPRRIAEELVIQTLRGSVDYYAEKKDHPAHLRNEVTSPGGTSAAALYYLEKAGFRTAISRAVWAAFERSQELGEGKSTHSPES